MDLSNEKLFDKYEMFSCHSRSERVQEEYDDVMSVSEDVRNLLGKLL